MSATTKLTIEPHGPPGSFAIYLGRDDEHHGLNLATLYDVDPQYKDALFKAITEAYDGAATIARLERESFEWSTRIEALSAENERLRSSSVNVDELAAAVAQEVVVLMAERLARVWQE